MWPKSTDLSCTFLIVWPSMYNALIYTSTNMFFFNPSSHKLQQINSGRYNGVAEGIRSKIL